MAYVLERLAGCGEHSDLAGVVLPPPHGDIDVVGINLQRASPATGALGSDQHGTASGEWIEDKAIAPRAVLHGVCHEGDWLDRGMHRELLKPARLKAVDPCIVPDIRPRPAILTELECVDVRRGAVLPNEHEFMLGTVKCAHSGIGLVPDAKVLEFGVDSIAGGEHF